MKILSIYLTILVLYEGHFDVECVGTTATVKANLFGAIVGYPAPAPAESFPSMILPVETSGRCYLANLQFVVNKMNPIFKEFLFVCPAESEDELNKNQQHSKTKNALFIRKIHDNSNTQSSQSFMSTLFSGKKPEIIEQKCKDRVIPSIINIGRQKFDHTDVDLYLVGYEIFLGEDRISSYSIDYEPAELPDNRFAWFNLYTIAFNRKTRDVVSVFSHALYGYRLNSQPSNEPSSSDRKPELNYSLGNLDFYGGESLIASVYKEVPQTSVFLEAFKKVELSNDYNFLDWPQNRYLQGVHLAPLEGFGIPLFQLAGQTFGNVAPMWYSIYKITWSNVETHIKYLVRGINGINVVTGTYGTLTLSGVEIYLESDNKVRVPAAFWKIISYSKKEGEIFNIIIVTMNNPYEETENPICEINQCRDFGWDNVQQDYLPMGITSCCELTEKILANLHLSGCMKVDKTLDLKRVPHWRNEELTLNIKSYIENQIGNVNIEKPVDEYKNEEIVLEGNEDEEVTLSNFFSILYKNFEAVLFSYIPSIPLLAKKSDGGVDSATSDQINTEESH